MEGITWGFAAAGLVVGTAVGATGVGGGSLMTPILILFYGISPAVAVGTDLLYASISKSFGVLLYRKRNGMDWRIVGWLSLGSVPAALVTLYVLHQVGMSPTLDKVIKLTLAIAVIVTASFTLLQDVLLSRVRRITPIREWQSHHQIAGTVLSGLLIGAVVTVSSVGAGVIGMMLLMWLYPKHPPQQLVGVDLAHAVLITAIAGLGHAKLGTVDTAMLLGLLVGALPGIWIGTRLGFRLDAKSLKKLISALLILVGGMTLHRALG